MNEEYWMEYFSRELDKLIGQNEKTPTCGAPTHLHEALQVAEELAPLNFSAESRQRDVLRRRMLAQAHQLQEANMKTLHWRRALIGSIVGTVAVLMLTLTLFYPGGVMAAARQVIETIQTITLGPHTSIIQVAPDSKAHDVPPDPNAWEVSTEIGTYGGDRVPGVEPAVQSFATVEEAQSAVGWHIVTPSYLPNGYALREVKVAPLSAPDMIILFYSGPAHDLVIAQTHNEPPSNPNEMRGNTIMTNGTLEETDLDGHTAAWGNGKVLTWESDNTTYEVGGIGLTQDEAKQIARSLR